MPSTKEPRSPKRLDDQLRTFDGTPQPAAGPTPPFVSPDAIDCEGGVLAGGADEEGAAVVLEGDLARGMLRDWGLEGGGCFWTDTRAATLGDCPSIPFGCTLLLTVSALWAPLSSNACP